MNRAYDIDEPWRQTRLIGVSLTVALALFTVIAFALVVAESDLGQWRAAKVGLGTTFELIWWIIQWPVAFVGVILTVDVL